MRMTFISALTVWLTQAVMDGFMSIKRLMNSFMAIYTNPAGHVALLTLYYLAILAGLIIMYGRGNFTTPKFVYQGF